MPRALPLLPRPFSSSPGGRPWDRRQVGGDGLEEPEPYAAQSIESKVFPMQQQQQQQQQTLIQPRDSILEAMLAAYASVLFKGQVSGLITKFDRLLCKYLDVPRWKRSSVTNRNLMLFSAILGLDSLLYSGVHPVVKNAEFRELMKKNEFRTPKEAFEKYLIEPFEEIFRRLITSEDSSKEKLSGFVSEKIVNELAVMPFWNARDTSAKVKLVSSVVRLQPFVLDKMEDAPYGGDLNLLMRMYRWFRTNIQKYDIPFSLADYAFFSSYHVLMEQEAKKIDVSADVHYVLRESSPKDTNSSEPKDGTQESASDVSYFVSTWRYKMAYDLKNTSVVPKWELDSILSTRHLLTLNKESGDMKLSSPLGTHFK